MGDAADMALEMVEDFEEARMLWHSGQMDFQEAFVRGIIDHLGREMGPGGKVLSDEEFTVEIVP